MRIQLVVALVAAILCLTTKAFAEPDPNFHVYLCFGQSNMEGHRGPEPLEKTVDKRFEVLAAVDFPNMGRKKGHWYDAVPPLCRPTTGLCPADCFGRTLVANLPEKIRVGVVNVAVAGCRIELFEKETSRAYGESRSTASWMKGMIKEYDGDPYQTLVDMGRLAQKDGVIRGILLHQGESNTGDGKWPAKVKGIYDNLMKDLNLKAEEVPLLAGEVVHADQKGQCAAMNKIIGTLPETLPNSYIISSKGCTTAEGLHFDAAGYRELGKRYGEKMVTLLGYEVKKPATEPAAEPKGR
jgi:hypothetical protein